MKHERFKHLFQPEPKIHNMKMRKNNKIKVQFASKKRLKNSAIPHMQRLADKYFQEKEEKETSSIK